MSDIYKISVALAMSSNHNAVLSALSAGLLGVHANVNKLTTNFGRLKTAIGGALAVGAGVTILDTMVKLVEKTKEYSGELAKLENLGGGMAKDVASGEIAKRAFDISSRVHMKVTDLMKIPGASYSILGQEDSMKVWESLAKFSWVMQNQKDFKGDAGADLQKFLRAGELGGRLTDPTTHKAAVEELEKFLDLSQKVMAATHGMVTPTTLLGMSQQAGFSMRGMSDEGFMNMAIAAQAMGGPRSGTALLSLYNQLAGGKMTPTAAKSMEDLGLLKEGEWKASKGGGVIVDDSAKARLSKLLGKNPMDFVDKIYKDLEAQGITDPAEQQRRMSSAMSRQTSQRLVGEMMMNRDQIAAERGRMEQGAGSGQAFDTFNNKSVEANLESLKNAWANLLFAVAGPQSEASISIMKQLTGALDGMTGWVRGIDPGTAKVIAEVMVGVGAGLTALGAVALVTLAGIPGVLIGLAVALGALAALEWNSIKAGMEEHVRAMKAFGTAVSGLASIAWGSITAGLETVKNALNAFVDALAGIAAKMVKPFTNPGNVPGVDNPAGDFGGIKKDSNFRFDPGSGGTLKAQPISLSLNVDGRTLAQMVSDKLEYLYEHPTGAPSYDGMRRHIPSDGGMIGT
jgi:hypothetical protein